MNGVWVALSETVSAPLYRPLVVVIGLELIAIQMQIFWLLWKTVVTRARLRETRRFRTEMGDPLGEALASADPVALAACTRRARTYAPEAVQAHLESLMELSVGNTNALLVEMYGELGYTRAAMKATRSWRVSNRIRALRRLSLVARSGEAELLSKMGSVHEHIVRLLVAQIMAKAGTPEQLFSVLRDLERPRRIMDQPFAAILATASRTHIEFLIARLEELADPSVRRLVLEVSARVTPAACARVLPEAARHPHKELRIGACQAAAMLGFPSLVPLMTTALGDPESEVRGQAAKALGRLQCEESIESLAAALGDPAFWVRQNAAASLAALGAPGHLRLEEIARTGTDRFAADSARQELRRQSLLTSGIGVAA